MNQFNTTADSVDRDGNTRILGSEESNCSIRCKHETTTIPPPAPTLVIDPNTLTSTNSNPHNAQHQHSPPADVLVGPAPQEDNRVDLDTSLCTMSDTTATDTTETDSATDTATDITSTSAVAPPCSSSSTLIADSHLPSSTVSSLCPAEISFHTGSATEGVTLSSSEFVTDHEQGSILLPLPDLMKQQQEQRDLQEEQDPIQELNRCSSPEHDQEDDQSKATSFPLGQSPSLNVHTKVHSATFVRPASSSSSSYSSSSSSSLSDYLIIGQEPIERDDSEYGDGRGSDRSLPTSSRSSSRDSSSSSSSSSRRRRRRQEEEQQQRYEAFGNEDASLEYQNDENHLRTSPRPSLSRSNSRQKSPSQGRRRRESHVDESYGEVSDETYLFDHQQQHSHPHQQQLTETDYYPDEFSRSSTPQGDRTRRRRSTRGGYAQQQQQQLEEEPTTETEAAAAAIGALPALPALKIPSLRSITRSIAELVIASVICITLVSCMFAFSYVSSGANHMLGWYADQRIGQRIREGIKEREHFVQEALEKMAGEEYARVKRRSQQFHQQQQQQRQYGNPHSQRYQQQYQQQREQRQRDREQQERKKEGLSTAEWQELIRAASVSFMAKFTAAPTTTRGPPPRR
ncbi:hypothetical protein BGZ65_003107 [Modicella reniformis]|uniref:Uncharacterized protein n=1 Tax=Modicella reniformis TaxID=1440133 RepID=A0A9P6J1Y9_9FUNG|nr:hypothetical protein BGZ65_003107 [Modicella reniformis]